NLDRPRQAAALDGRADRQGQEARGFPDPLSRAAHAGGTPAAGRHPAPPGPLTPAAPMAPARVRPSRIVTAGHRDVFAFASMVLDRASAPVPTWPAGPSQDGAVADAGIARTLLGVRHRAVARVGTVRRLARGDLGDLRRRAAEAGARRLRRPGQGLPPG